MTTSNCRTPFIIRFMDTKPRILMELTNTTEMTLKSIEILTIFLKDEGSAAGSSRAHIRFDRINSVQPNGKAVISHRTWINGMPASEAQDQIGRLQVVAGAVKPMSWTFPGRIWRGRCSFREYQSVTRGTNSCYTRNWNKNYTRQGRQ